jgi:hypothetical protein
LEWGEELGRKCPCAFVALQSSGKSIWFSSKEGPLVRWYWSGDAARLEVAQQTLLCTSDGWARGWFPKPSI